MIDKFFTDLVGTKVNVLTNTTATRYGPISSYRVDDKAFMTKIDARPERVRVKIPGCLYTAEFDLSRVNIYVDEDGLITGVEKG
jgi:hypothetical protein